MGDIEMKSNDRQSFRKSLAWLKRFINTRNQNSDGNAGSAKSRYNRNGSPAKLKRNDRARSSRPSRETQPATAYAFIDGTQPATHHISNSGKFTGILADEDEQRGPLASNRSTAPTVATNAETVRSDAAYSKAGTSATMGKSYASGGPNSVFSSPNVSNRSLTTTLTTIQSTAAGANTIHNNHVSGGMHQTNPGSLGSTSQYFSHQFPTTPASAVPQHLSRHVSSHIPLSYRGAVANNLLTDNASILTLASSSHRQGRRNSTDTNASVRAIAPMSAWGGSRESLPLSVLSQNQDGYHASPLASPLVGASLAGPALPQGVHASGVRNIPAALTTSDRDRASLHSAAGVNAPMLSGERNSIYAGRSGGGGAWLPSDSALIDGGISNVRLGPWDGGSVRDVASEHARHGSTAGAGGIRV